MQYAVSIRNGQLAVIESDVGTSPLLRVYNGTPPANVATALSGNTLLAEGTLPSDWMAAPSSGSVGKTGTWTLTGQAGAVGGTAGTFFRIYASDGTTAKIQGTWGTSGELVPDNNSIASGQTVTINGFTVADANG